MKLRSALKEERRNGEEEEGHGTGCYSARGGSTERQRDADDEGGSECCRVPRLVGRLVGPLARARLSVGRSNYIVRAMTMGCTVQPPAVAGLVTLQAQYWYT